MHLRKRLDSQDSTTTDGNPASVTDNHSRGADNLTNFEADHAGADNYHVCDNDHQLGGSNYHSNADHSCAAALYDINDHNYNVSSSAARDLYHPDTHFRQSKRHVGRDVDQLSRGIRQRYARGDR
jgi:hypothetical protein